MLRRVIDFGIRPVPRAIPDGGEPIAQNLRMETNMTTTNSFNAESVLNTVKTAFAPVTDALKNFQNMEVPEAAREFVKKAAGTAKDRAAEIHTGSEKVTSAIETAVAGSVSETAKISRNIQQAVYDDAQALFAGCLLYTSPSPRDS